MRYSIDRIEGKMAVCEREDGIFESFPLERLYPGAAEGDLFTLDGEIAVPLPEETEQIREKNILLQQSLFEEE